MTTSTAASLASTPLDRLLGDLETSRAGLTEADAVARLKRCGPNDALAHEGHPLAVQFLLRFLNPLVLILLFASALSALAGDTASFVIVVVIVTLSVILDFVQEVRAQNAVDALRRSVAPKALVVRDGRERELHFEELVPGDVVKLSAGDHRPCGCKADRRARPLRQSGAADGRALPGREACLRSCRRDRAARRGDQSCLHGNFRRQRHRDRGRLPDGERDAHRRPRHPACPPPATGCFRDWGAQVRVPDPARDLLPRAVRAGDQRALPAALARVDHVLARARGRPHS